MRLGRPRERVYRRGRTGPLILRGGDDRSRHSTTPHRGSHFADEGHTRRGRAARAPCGGRGGSDGVFALATAADAG